MRGAIRTAQRLPIGTAGLAEGFNGGRGILRAGRPAAPAANRTPETPLGATLEALVRNARPTDLDAAVRLLAANGADDEGGRDDVDFLRNLLYVPSATVVVAEAGRRVVGLGVLSIRPSVRSGPFVGVIDELGLAGEGLDAADRRDAGDQIVEHLATSARNKGCTRIEVPEPLASAEPSRWKRLGFASRGRTLGRPLSRPIG